MATERRELHKERLHLRSLYLLYEITVSASQSPSTADEAWYWPKHILHSGWLCLILRLLFREMWFIDCSKQQGRHVGAVGLILSANMYRDTSNILLAASLLHSTCKTKVYNTLHHILIGWAAEYNRSYTEYNRSYTPVENCTIIVCTKLPWCKG